MYNQNNEKIGDIRELIAAAAARSSPRLLASMASSAWISTIWRSPSTSLRL
ncbi:hypothetical protein [Microvirga ossetica]|uniref:hypothetical protein n=1 Tax=Microvirga ossetica TaxID=1882682 RepID=UPI003AAC5F08